jgi:hypothetical protein
MVVAIFWTDHLFSPLGTMVKQLGFEWLQVLQKPFALSFHVPVLVLPDCSRGSRVIFPSGVKVILNFVPEGVVALKGWPVKKVVWMSLGAMGSAAEAALAPTSTTAKANEPTRSTAKSPFRARRKSIQPISLAICRKLFEVRPRRRYNLFLRGPQATLRGKPMDERIQAFLADVLALEDEEPNAVREAVRVALAD